MDWIIDVFYSWVRLSCLYLCMIYTFWCDGILQNFNVCFVCFSVLGGYLRRAWHWPHRYLPWWLRPSVGENQRLLQWGHRLVMPNQTPATLQLANIVQFVDYSSVNLISTVRLFGLVMCIYPCNTLTKHNSILHYLVEHYLFIHTGVYLETFKCYVNDKWCVNYSI